MKVYVLQRLIFVLAAILLFSNCSHLEQTASSASHKKIGNNIAKSKLNHASVFFGRAPFSKAYEFNFTTIHNNPFSLVFKLNESSFSNSTLTYTSENKTHLDTNQINEDLGFLTALKKNLPHANEVAWQTVSQQAADETREGYKLMHQYIRYKRWEFIQ